MAATVQVEDGGGHRADCSELRCNLVIKGWRPMKGNRSHHVPVLEGGGGGVVSDQATGRPCPPTLSLPGQDFAVCAIIDRLMPDTARVPVVETYSDSAWVRTPPTAMVSWCGTMKSELKMVAPTTGQEGPTVQHPSCG